MKYFKYLLFAFLVLCSVHVSAVCYHPATYPGTAHKPFPSTICYPEDGGNGYCQFRVINNGLDIQVPCTNPDGCGSTPAYAVDLQSISSKVYKNSDCTNPPLQDGCVQLPNGNIECEDEEDDEQNPVLDCTADSCLNPDNKRCPSGYTSGSFNGQRMCVKNDEPDPEECEGDSCSDDQRIIDAVNDANNSITSSIYSLGDTFSNSLNQIKDLLSDISDKIQNIGNGNNNNNNGNGNGNNNGNDEVDTSELAADLNVSEIDEQSLDQNLFSYSAQCPADNVLHLDFMGRSITYTFSYQEICDALYSLSFIVMIFSYLISAYIVSRA